MEHFHKYILWLNLGAILLVFWIFAMRWRHHKRYGIVFPQVSPDRIRFHEVRASGCSHKTTFTRIAGSSRCLDVTVTDDEVWVRLGFPFNIIGSMADMEHRIPRNSVISVQPSGSGRSLSLDYRDQEGRTYRLSLALQAPEDFLKALGYQSQAR
jgi:hypothetical protein